MPNKPDSFRIGVINWDCAAPPDTFFGHYTSQSLSPEHFRYCTPYYAHLDGPNRIYHTYKTQAEYDRELSYAIEAGIDYFAYTWYTEEALDRDDIEGKLHEITHARRMHLSSPLRNRIKLCAVFVCSHIHTDRDFEKLAQEMKQPHYEKIDGRPLVYLFGGYRVDYIDRLRALCARHALPAPYIVFLNNGVESPDGDYSKADAVSGYCCCAQNVTSHQQLCDVNEQENERRKKYGLPIIPMFSMGWNPRPRLEHPVPWYGYPDVDYAPYATPAELKAGAAQLCRWIRKNPDATRPRHIMVFAWNEFEEGGFICPTYHADGSINEERVRAFREISEAFKAEL